MSIEVEVNGVIHEFPDTMSQADIKAALAKQYGPKPREQSIWGTLRDNVIGDDDPNTHNFGEKVGAALNKAGEAMTFGLVGDEADAAVRTGAGLWGDYDATLAAERQKEEVLERDNPGLAFGAELGGALVSTALPFGAAARAHGAARGLATSALAGTGMGATYSAMEGEGADHRKQSALIGAILGGSIGMAAPFFGGGVQKIANSRALKRALAGARRGAPTTDELRAAGRAAYQQIDDAGVQVTPQSFDGARGRILDALRSRGLDELPGPGSLTPKSARAVQIGSEMSDDLAKHPTAALPFSSLDQLRRHAGTAAADVGNKTDSALGAEMISQIDDYVKGLTAKDVTTGDIKTLQTMLPKARDIWGRMSRSQLVDDAIENSENYLSGGASGIRNQFARILRSPKLSRGFSDAELKVMRRVAQGSLPEQILYLASSGIGNIGTIGLGAATGGFGGAMIGAAAAAGLRKAAQSLAGRNAETARRVVASGAVHGPVVASDQARRISEAIMRRIGAVAPQQIQ